MFGVRSLQEVMWYGVPSCVLHRILPVVASIPYAQSFSVDTSRVLPTTSGCEYTWPLTEVLKIWPNDPFCSAVAVSVGSLGSQLSRRLFCETVVSSLAGPAPGAAGAA